MGPSRVGSTPSAQSLCDARPTRCCVIRRAGVVYWVLKTVVYAVAGQHAEGEGEEARDERDE